MGQENMSYFIYLKTSLFSLKQDFHFLQCKVFNVKSWFLQLPDDHIRVPETSSSDNNNFKLTFYTHSTVYSIEHSYSTTNISSIDILLYKSIISVIYIIYYLYYIIYIYTIILQNSAYFYLGILRVCYQEKV